MPACDFPGCRRNSHFYDYYKDPTKKYSFHRVPNNQRVSVEKLLNMTAAKKNKANLYICDNHMRPGSYIISNKKKRLRSDATFTELLILPGEEGTPATTTTQHVPTTPGSSKLTREEMAATSFEENSYENSEPEFSMDEDDEEEDVSYTAPAHVDRGRRPDNHQAAYVNHNKSLPVLDNKLRENSEEIANLKATLAKTERKFIESERVKRELDERLKRASTHQQSEHDAKDKEIASLKKQVQQLQADVQALAEANKALSLDLGVYRKLVQFETSKNGSPLIEPTKQWRNKRLRSDDVEPVEQKSTLLTPAQASPAPVEPSIPAVNTSSSNPLTNGSSEVPNGTLEEIRKWLRTSRQF